MVPGRLDFGPHSDSSVLISLGSRVFLLSCYMLSPLFICGIVFIKLVVDADISGKHDRTYALSLFINILLLALLRSLSILLLTDV